MTTPIDHILETPMLAEIAGSLSAGRRVVARGSAGSATHLIAAAIGKIAARRVVLVAAHLDEADEAVDELLSMGVEAARFPALEALPGESAAALDLFAERLRVVRGLGSGTLPRVLVAPIQAFMQGVPPIESLEKLSREISRGQTLSMSGLVRWLEGAGYSRRDAVEEPGEFAVRGGILDVFPPGGGEASAAKAVPVRLDFFGDEVEKLTEIDINTMGSDRAIDKVELLAADPSLIQSDRGVLLPTLLPSGVIVVLSELAEVVEQARGYYERVTDARGIFGPPAVLAALQKHAHAIAEINRFSAGSASADAAVELPVATIPPFSKDLAEAMKELATLAGEGRALVCCQNEGERHRFGELLVEHLSGGSSRIAATVAYVHEGFSWLDAPGQTKQSVAVVPYHELLNRFTVRRRGGKISAGRAMDTFLDLSVGDYVVHADHGIAQLIGLAMMTPRDLPGAPKAVKGKKELDEQEYLVLEFAGKSKLYIPAVQIDLVQKYVGGFKGKPPLSTLGGTRWQNQKDKVEESVRDLAGELLRVRAAREHIPGITFPGDTAWQREFEDEFPYEETEDQLSGLAAIKGDMQKDRPMDRLICGDVGFGKTELAIRAAFKAAEFGKQVAVLVPTTVLAEQHERTFKSRFAGYPFRIESISRFKEGKETREILEAARKGQIDILIGTHRVLSDDVKFADLGLVVVDEEQRFGVEHKERLLRLRLTADVLTLSATPIPRTLHMALLGIRDISNLTTPPVDRRAIVTEVMPYNERRVQQAIKRELAREGQIFYVHNAIHNIKEVADRVQALAPEARVVFGHGQMEGDELEDVMLKFIRGDADILVSTTIIESGIDIPTANTMIIDDADRFGLAQLHQLRGRVGRSKHRAYCYLLLPQERALTDQGKKRLAAIEQYSMLGAGFKIAMRDLEIRGAGNILGPEQSGHIAAVGYEMYCQLLEGAVHELKAEAPRARPSATSIEIGLTGTIPRSYIPSDQRRLEAYRRIATAVTKADLDKVKADMVAAYGDPPRITVRLFLLAELRTACAAMGVKTATLRGSDVVFLVTDAKRVAEKLAAVPAGQTKAIEARVSVLASQTSDTLAEVYFRPPEKYLEPETLLSVLRKRLCGP